MTERTTNHNQAWLEKNFRNSPDVETVHEFHEEVVNRKSKLKDTLSDEFLSFRKQVRDLLGIGDEDIAIIFGEQSVGLNEPPLIVGKRLLFSHGQRKYGWKGIEIDASSDVIGSEKGLSQAIIPSSNDPSGKSELHILSVKRYSNTPAYLVNSKDVFIKEMISGLRKDYPLSHPEISRRVEQAVSRYQEGGRYSEAQEKLLQSLHSALGIDYKAIIIQDQDFDTRIAKMRGLDIIMKYWKQITSISRQNTLDTVRVPDEEELPFYVIGEERGMRARVVSAEDTNDSLVMLTHPQDKDKVWTKKPVPLDEILTNYPISFRAIPRIILMNFIADGHITGGGALYNIPARKAFEAVYRTQYIPLIWMDVNTEGLGLFQYQSAATFRRERRPGYKQAEQLVKRGLASSWDLYISRPTNAPEQVGEILDTPDLETKQRVTLKL